MAEIETRIRSSLRLVREAIRAVEADPELFREAVERIEKANGAPLAIPAEKPDAILREIERILANALDRLGSPLGR
jgi:CO dehydrogenase/acetyl-CoA synthase gamma subunit (corrinoid Fe-S protein)